MDWEKGLACCGLACAVCSENASCAGCRDGGCAGKDWCQNRRCCLEKGFAGCWECGAFPCDAPMLQKRRVRAFAAFVREYGETRLLSCLEAGEKAGLRYHYPGELVGDYDRPADPEGVWALLLRAQAEEPTQRKPMETDGKGLEHGNGNGL